MKKAVLLVFGFIALMSIFVISATDTGVPEKDVEAKANKKLSADAELYKAVLNSVMKEEFERVDTLACYLGAFDEIDFRNERKITDAVVLINTMRNLGYADLQGNAVNYKGIDQGNISDTEYFRETLTLEQGEKTLTYVQNPERDGEGSLIYSAPVIHDNSVVGIVYGDIYPFDLESVMDEISLRNESALYVVNRDGVAGLANRIGKKRMEEYDCLFGHSEHARYDSNLCSFFVNEDESSGEGICKIEGEQTEYLYYIPLGIGEWYIVNVMTYDRLEEMTFGNREGRFAAYHKIRTCYFLTVAVMGAFILCLCRKLCMAAGAAEKNTFCIKAGVTKQDISCIEADMAESDTVSGEACVTEKNAVSAEACVTDRDAVNAETCVTEKEAVSVEEGAAELFVRTFGSFDLFVSGKPVCFTNSKEKELLAILVDRKGGTLSAEEAVGILWEDEPAGRKQMDRYRKLAQRLKDTLERAGAGEVLINEKGVRSLNTRRILCDYYEALKNDLSFIKEYKGSYMPNYSWAEDTNAHLTELSCGWMNSR